MKQRRCARARARLGGLAVAAAAVAVIALAGCAAGEPAGAGAAAEPARPAIEGPLFCGSTEIAAEALDERRPATELPPDVVAALESPLVLGIAPLTTWFVVEERDDRLVIMTEHDEPVDLGGGDIRSFGLVAISTTPNPAIPLDAPWGIDTAADCSPRIALGDLGDVGDLDDVTLTLDPDAPPEAQADELALLATESACNSGQPATGRIEVIDVVETETTVEVVVGVRPRSGGATCPSNPPTPFTIELERPLGDRMILDARVVPARELALPS
ncbi:hypothetical protein FLP10_08030 [Agromyces intestinalis]|uniref:Uncharacterized protein n=1 Tax=Agromyces intestinalis TaxID=2592652 RepID=A0A5C1YHX3_9MICO|nr:hypothetical protein [Agromyces intestinalis]QEO14372.1 hypothetical protein FLP10_08030 [Agromyces intestinalis]